MIHPSYIELMNVANEGCTEEAPVVHSRYSIVIAAAKRARQLIDNAEPMIEDMEGEKALSIAVKELYEGKVRILPETEDEEVLYAEDIPDTVAEDSTEAADEEAAPAEEPTAETDQEAGE